MKISDLAKNVADKIDDLIVAHTAESSPFRSTGEVRRELSEAIADMIHEVIWIIKSE